MFSLRPTRHLNAARVALSSARATRPAPTASFARRYASSDYGSGEQNQGASNPSVGKEHPGPPPPSAAKQGQGNQQQQPSQGQEKQQGGEAGKSQKGSESKSTSAPQPKILSELPPTESEQSEDVAQHNREMDKRADKAHEKASNEDAKDDKVPKGFWKGQGGRDNTP